MNILAGEKKESDKLELKEIINHLKNKGAEKVILGCTELPLLLTGEEMVDTIRILAEAVVREAIDI